MAGITFSSSAFTEATEPVRSLFYCAVANHHYLRQLVFSAIITTSMVVLFFYVNLLFYKTHIRKHQRSRFRNRDGVSAIIQRGSATGFAFNLYAVTLVKGIPIRNYLACNFFSWA